MSNFVDALAGKIKVLNADLAEHQEAIQSINTKLELLGELYLEESGMPAPVSKKKPGRPKGSNKKAPAKGNHGVDDELYRESVRHLGTLEGGGTSPELQERMMKKKFIPQPRPTHSLGPGIKAGTRKQVEFASEFRKTNANVSIEDGEEV